MIVEPKQIISRTAPLIEYLKIQRENQRLMKSVEIGTTILFISFFTLAAIRPAIVTISALVGEIKSKEFLSKSMKTKINQVMLAQDNFSQIQEKYLVVNSVLPDSPEMTNASTQILGAVMESNSKIDKVTFNTEKKESDDEGPKNNGNLSQYEVNFGVYSSFSDGIKFLSNLYANKRLNEIKDIYIAPEKDKNNKEVSGNKLLFRFNLNLFHWQEKQ